MVRIGLTISLALWLVLALPATAHAEGGVTRDQALEALGSYFNGKITKAEAEAVVDSYHGTGGPAPSSSPGSNGVTKPQPVRAPQQQTTGDTEDQTPEPVDWLSCHGGTPAIVSGSMPEEGTYSLLITSDSEEQTMTVTFEESELDPIVVDLSDCDVWGS